MNADVIVIGGGVVGSALAYGIAKAGSRVLVLDGADGDFRAARANFGLVWVQGKGANLPPYSVFTRKSSDLWPSFRDGLMENSKLPVDYSCNGGLAFCLGEDELERRCELLKLIHRQGVDIDTEMLDRRQLDDLLPTLSLGPQVVGASFCHRDGHVNPLQLLAALHHAIPSMGGRVAYRSTVSTVRSESGGFCVAGPAGEWHARRVIVAAGVATADLVRPLGLDLPLRVERGQVLVTERATSLLPLPASGLRQTAEGTMMIGATHENVGLDTGVTAAAAKRLAQRAIAIAPKLAELRLVRQWSGLRVLSPDKGPVYAEAPSHPGLFAVFCHSGVTLAAAHSELVGPALAQGQLPAAVHPFDRGRFDVQKCA